MRLNTANRSFVALLVLAAVPYVLLGFAGCALVGAVVYELYTGGWSAITAGSQDLRPALAFFGLLGLGSALGFASIITQLRASRRLTARVRALRVATPGDVADVATRGKVAGRIDVVDSPEAFSFAYGFISPRIAVSQGLIEALSTAELEAVLEHERYHVRTWDPAKVVLARAFPRATFYLPALRHLRRRYVAGRELAADRRAMRACGEPALAGALYKVIRGPAWPELAQAAAIGGPELLDARVEQLETGDEPAVPPVSTAAKLATAIGLAALAALLALSFAGLDDPFAFMRDRGFGRGGMMRNDHRRGPWGFVGFAISTIIWALAGVWLWRRFRRRTA
ncbi:MAG: M56 family metallopeptidase [Actinomycetota bacterium]